MRLPYDVQRCTGLLIGSTDLHCNQRHTCQRFIEWENWLNDDDAPWGISAAAAEPDCQIKIEVKHADQ